MGGGHSKIVSFREAIANFNEQELKVLSSTFRKLCLYTNQSSSASAASSQRFDEDTLRKHLHFIEPSLCSRIFKIYISFSKEVFAPNATPSLSANSKDDTSSFVTYEGFICAVATCCKADLDAKLHFVFGLFDGDRKGTIGSTEIRETLKDLQSSSMKALHCDLLNVNTTVYSNEKDLQTTTDDDNKSSSDDNDEKKLQKSVEQNEKLERRIESLLEALAISIENHHNKSHPENQTSFNSVDFKHFKTWLLHNLSEVLDFVDFIIRREFMPNLEVPDSLQGKLLPTPIKRIGHSELLNDQLTEKLKSLVPASISNFNLVLLYSSTQHGYSMNTLCHALQVKRREILNCTLLVVKDSNGYIFGGFASEPWRKFSFEFYGTSECFLFTLLPTFQHFPSTGKNSNFQYSNEKGIAFGGSRDFHALWLDEAFLSGKSNLCDTFHSDCLASENEFRVKTIECWGFVEPAQTKFIEDSAQETEDTEKKKSVLDNKQNTFILDLIGKNYSSMVRE